MVSLSRFVQQHMAVQPRSCLRHCSSNESFELQCARGTLYVHRPGKSVANDMRCQLRRTPFGVLKGSIHFYKTNAKSQLHANPKTSRQRHASPTIRYQFGMKKWHPFKIERDAIIGTPISSTSSPTTCVADLQSKFSVYIKDLVN